MLQKFVSKNTRAFVPLIWRFRRGRAIITGDVSSGKGLMTSVAREVAVILYPRHSLPPFLLGPLAPPPGISETEDDLRP